MINLDAASGQLRVAPDRLDLGGGVLVLPLGAFGQDQRAERVDIIRQIGGFVGHVPILRMFAVCFQPSIQSQIVAPMLLRGRVMLKTCLWHGNPAPWSHLQFRLRSRGPGDLAPIDPFNEHR